MNISICFHNLLSHSAFITLIVYHRSSFSKSLCVLLSFTSYIFFSTKRRRRKKEQTKQKTKKIQNNLFNIIWELAIHLFPMSVNILFSFRLFFCLSFCFYSSAPPLQSFLHWMMFCMLLISGSRFEVILCFLLLEDQLKVLHIHVIFHESSRRKRKRDGKQWRLNFVIENIYI